MALAGCAALGACFTSERPLFRNHDAVTPFADGERFVWRRADSEDDVVTYDREGMLYRLGPWSGSDPLTELMFIDIPETPEQDFIAQMRLDQSGSRLYAFYWRTDVGFRVLNSDSAFAEGGPGWEAFVSVCGRRASISGCELANVGELRRLYLKGVYPAFVVGTATPADYVDQIAWAEAEQEKPQEQ